MPEFMKVEAGNEMFLRDFPAACVCGSQKSPIVATGLTYRVAGSPTGIGQIYLCRLCVTRAARAIGLVKGEELTRLQSAGDELEQAAKEVSERQRLIETLSASGAEKDRKIETQRAFIEELQSEAAQRKHLAELIASNARELTAA